jgi:hypothetical protein
MTVYSFLFLSGYIGSLLSLFKGTKKIIFIFFIFSIFVLFILSGFRSINVGYDTQGHLMLFQRVANGILSFSDYKEPGYTLLSLIVSFFGNFNLFLVVYASISLFILYYSIKYFSINPYISLYIYYAFYFLGNNMAKLRASMAILLLTIALIYLYKNQKKYFVIFVLIAMTFHNASIFFFVLLFLNKIKLSKRRMYFLIIVAVIIGQSAIPEIFYRQFLVNNIMISALNLAPVTTLIRYAESSHTIRESGGYLGYLYILLNSILVVWFYDKLKLLKDKKAVFLAKIYYWGTILFFILFDLALINSRLTMPFLVTQIFLVPYLFNCFKNKSLRLSFAALYMISVFIRGYYNFLGVYDYFVPFTF